MRPRLFHLLGGIFFSMTVTAQTLPGHALMFSADYASNSEVLGTFSNAAPQPSWSPSVSFLSKWGVDFSLNAYAIGNSDDSLENYTGELDLMLGYNFKPVKGLIIYPSYTRFLHTGNSNAMKSIFRNDFHLDVDYTWKFINLGVSAGYFTGQQHTFYMALHNSYQISFNRIFSKNDALSVQPGVDFNFGDYEYLNLYYLESLENNRTYLYYLMLNPVIRRYVYEERQNHPSLSREDILIAYLEDRAGDQTKLTSVGFSLPVSYMIGNFSLNVGIYAYLPVNQPDYLGSDVQFFYNIGISYLIFSDR